MHVRSLPALLVFAAFLAPHAAAAKVVHLGCRDGIAPPEPQAACRVGCGRPVRCDADEQCDGICTFAIRVCGEVACTDRLVGVPVGRHQKVRLSTTLEGAPTTFVLRCRPHPPTIPCPVPSTSTTTVTTTSSTTLPGEVCRTDPECDDGNPCTHDACMNGTCVHECLCFGPTGEVTCCPGPGPCPVPATTPCGQLTCDAATEMCVAREPIGPAIVHACVPVPAGCESNRTCACAGASLCQPPFDTCRDAGPNAIDCECVACQ